uniref:Cytochrome P450 315a1, mitochondrial-like n=1 Tax=Hirondellea gigas TaxID=1518452 RepID=A0A2P2HY86_9CRUS
MASFYDVVSPVLTDHLNMLTILALITAVAVQVLLWPLFSRWNQYRQHRTAHYITDHRKGRTQGSPAAPYEDMPRMEGPSADYLRKLFDNPVYLHQYVALAHKQKGPVFRDGLGGPVDLVFLADPSCVGAVQRASGPYPGHVVPDAWTLYLRIRDRKRGLFFMDGEEWAVHRKILNQRLLRTQNLKMHVSALGSSTATLVETMWARQQDNTLNDTLLTALYRWSLESMFAVALGQRIGTFSCDEDSDACFNEFVDAIHNIFEQTAAMGQMPAAAAMEQQTDAWCKFSCACDTALDIASRYTTEAIRESHRRQTAGEPSECLLDQLLYEDHLSQDMVSRLIVDLFLAAADTTVWTANWLLYVLGRHRCHADAAREQLLNLQPSVLDSDGNLALEQDDLKRLSECRNILKETLRLYPVAPFLTRLLAQDSIIAGYHVPKNTMSIVSVCSIGRDPKYYENPLKFDPQRWHERPRDACSSTDKVATSHREDNGVNSTNVGPNPGTQNKGSRAERQDQCMGPASLSSLPWGVASRNCVGRTLAETLLTLFVAHMIKNFYISVKNENIHMKMQMISVPSESLDIELKRV